MNLFKTYELVRDFVFRYLNEYWPFLHRQIWRHRTGVKYIFAGGTAALVDLVVLYFLTDVVGLWYMISTMVAFVLALATSFILQKFWTFRDPALRRIKKQLVIYAVIGTLNFILNPALLYLFVEKFHVWYMLAAVIVMGALAIANYLVNKFIIFKKDITHESVND